MADISAKQASRRLLRLVMEALAAWALASSARARWLSFCQARTACLILRAFSGVMGTSSPDELIGVGAAEAEGFVGALLADGFQALGLGGGALVGDEAEGLFSAEPGSQIHALPVKPSA